VLGALNAVTRTGLAECPGGWRARIGDVRAVQPSASTGRVLPASGPVVGSLTTCYSSSSTSGKVSVRTTLRTTSPARTLKAEGDCTQQPLAAMPGVVAQTCGLYVRAPLLTIQDGLISGTLLVPSGDAAGTVDAGVWTVTDLT
jgi:hypothetical protein